ncbi:MAG: HAD-IG family 5'-nucleotidase [Acidimicrobiia bacterium]|nr:HAD-IG family 5'-nucleotidase [Acidimicrobiia bacterium]
MRPGGAPTPLLDRVFCCRSLRFDQVELVGFDMDYTLAAYRQPEMDRLAAEATLRRLVEAGYPPELARVGCPYDFPIRGLLVDVAEGNVLKMDRYRYVKMGYHGTRQLTRAERQRYEGRRPRLGSDRYRWVDTLYSLPDVAVYVAAIDLLEQLGPVDHAQLWEDVRVSADVAHRDGEVYRAVLADVDRYVARDPQLLAALEGLRRAGKRTFLLTNSGAATTERLMAALFDDAPRPRGAWRELFDVVVTEAAKPAWFVGQRAFADVDQPGRPVEHLEPGRLYRGGSRAEFERLVGVGGPHVLYVGDHIYGDVLRANVESGWRTCMIIQELVDELVADRAHAADLRRIDSLDAEVVELHEAARAARPCSAERARELEAERDGLEAKVDRSHHPYWGSLFRAGTELSMFGAQVEKYAWLYTTKASNLGAYSPYHFFRSPRVRLAHDGA